MEKTSHYSHWLIWIGLIGLSCWLIQAPPGWRSIARERPVHDLLQAKRLPLEQLLSAAGGPEEAPEFAEAPQLDTPSQQESGFNLSWQDQLVFTEEAITGTNTTNDTQEITAEECSPSLTSENKQETLLAENTQPSERPKESQPIRFPALSTAEGTTVVTMHDAMPKRPSNPSPRKRIAKLELEPQAVWSVPETLYTRLEALEEIDGCGRWARTVRRQVQNLVATAYPSPNQFQALRIELGKLPQLEQQLEVYEERAQLRLTHHSVLRWLDIFEGALALKQRPPRQSRTSLAAALREVETVLRRLPEADGWRTYLQLPQIEQIAGGSGKLTDEQRRLLAETWRRLQREDLSESQQAFLQQPAFVQLQLELPDWFNPEIDPATLMYCVKIVEENGRVDQEQQLSRYSEMLMQATKKDAQDLGRRLQWHYRNLNFRIAIRDQLLNRWLPQPEAETGPVRERIIGNLVLGRSTTTTQLGVRFVPDESRLALQMIAMGAVNSRTRMTVSGFRFANDTFSQYLAVTPLLIGRDGTRLGSPQVYVSSDNRLRDVQTSYDSIPVLGDVSQYWAMSQHESSRDEARQEIQQRVAQRVSQKLRENIAPQIEKSQQRFRSSVLGPLDQLGIKPTMADLQTTEDRLIIRTRLATPRQLGANTPRPRAPVNSWVSFQIHESALNNLAAQFELGGQRISPAELPKLIAGKLGRADKAPTIDAPDNIWFTPAVENPLRFRCEQGQLVLELRLDRIEGPRRVGENLQATVFFQPQIIDGQPQLVRVGAIHLRSDTLSRRALLMYRLLFNKLFDDDRPLELAPTGWQTDPRWEGLTVTQFDIRDGWIGAAVGPERTPSSGATMSAKGNR